MKAEELRLGNFIQGLNKAESIDIHLLIRLYFSSDSRGCHSYIPLTEEWLLKFGFEYASYSKDNGYRIDINSKSHYDRAFLWIELNGEYAVGVPYEASGGSFKIKFVHQLQNLYFALTGEELTIK